MWYKILYFERLKIVWKLSEPRESYVEKLSVFFSWGFSFENHGLIKLLRTLWYIYIKDIYGSLYENGSLLFSKFSAIKEKCNVSGLKRFVNIYCSLCRRIKYLILNFSKLQVSNLLSQQTLFFIGPSFKVREVTFLSWIVSFPSIFIHICKYRHLKFKKPLLQEEQ